MNRNMVLSTISDLPLLLKRGSFTIVYGAALVIHGVKEDTNDIDVLVDKDEFERLISEGHEAVPFNGHRKISLTKDIDLFDGGMYTEIESELFAGYINVQTVESVKVEKITRGREKDLKDVEIIDDWLIKNNRKQPLGEWKHPVSTPYFSS